ERRRVVVKLQEETSTYRLERPVRSPRRAACIRERIEPLSAAPTCIVSDPEIALHQENLFPVLVHERLRGVESGRESKQTGAEPPARLLIERARENLLLRARLRVVARWQLPACNHVDGCEFCMQFPECHFRSSA